VPVVTRKLPLDDGAMVSSHLDRFAKPHRCPAESRIVAGFEYADYPAQISDVRSVANWPVPEGKNLPDMRCR